MAAYYAIIMAGGQGKRCQQAQPKQYSLIGDKPVLHYSTMPFVRLSLFTRVLIVTAPHDTHYTQQHWAWKNNTTVQHCPVGGQERRDSLHGAITLCEDFCNKEDWIVIHDAARPLIQEKKIHEFINAMYYERIGGILATPLCDTLKKIHPDMTIHKTADREYYWCAQTPQMFRFEWIQRALNLGLCDTHTDTAELVEHYLRHSQTPERIRLHPGDPMNLKITHPEDLLFVRWYLSHQHKVLNI